MAIPTPDSAVADAMNRVLEAELAATAAIAAAQQQAELVLESARETRRRILDTARQRASRIHARAQSQLARAIAELERGTHGSSEFAGSSDAIAEQAVLALAHRLTSAEHEPS